MSDIVMSRTRAKLSILNELLSFPTIRGRDWVSDIDDMTPVIGDLVSLSCAPDSKWYLSWMVDYDPNDGWPKYLLESIEDGEQCWWSNVGVNFYNRERVSKRPTWKWDDKQFAFNDRWEKVCREKNAYIVLGTLPDFDGDKVTLGSRIRFGLSDFRHFKTWPNWKKVTMKQMGEFYDECVEAYHQHRDS